MNQSGYLILFSLICILLVACIFLVWFFSHRAKHKERLMMMEKGLDISASKDNRRGPGFPWQKIGVIIIGLSIGLVIISILASLTILDEGGNALPLAILGICGGIAMVIANRMGNDKSQS